MPKIKTTAVQRFEERRPGRKFLPLHFISERSQSFFECSFVSNKKKRARFLVADPNDLLSFVATDNRRRNPDWINQGKNCPEYDTGPFTKSHRVYVSILIQYSQAKHVCDFQFVNLNSRRKFLSSASVNSFF